MATTTTTTTDTVNAPIEELPGIGDTTKKKLNEIGIYTLLDLVVRSPYEVASRTGLDDDKVVAAMNKARVILMEGGKLEKDYISAAELREKRKAIGRIDTGSSALNDLLGGGVETQAMTEFFGEFSSGKTNICHTLAVMVQQPKDRGGLNGQALYIDTEGTFRPERAHQIAESRGFDAKGALEGITVARAYNSSHQELIAGDVGRIVREKGIKLVVLDSAVAHYRAEFLGRGTLAERQQKLNLMLHTLLKAADANNFAVVITNQVLASPDVFYGANPIHATGGHVVAHTSTYRIYLRKAQKHRIARMVDSPCQVEREVPFALTEMGVVDVPEEAAKK
jgi:DNA repair protein RadA